MVDGCMPVIDLIVNVLNPYTRKRCDTWMDFGVGMNAAVVLWQKKRHRNLKVLGPTRTWYYFLRELANSIDSLERHKMRGACRRGYNFPEPFSRIIPLGQ